MTAQQPAKVQTSLVHRPELDGIRGLAILLVIAQHINLPSTTLAGMVGVNLFFALSGYLITGILLTEIRATGKVDLKRFYERRVRRLVPALVAVVLATGVLMAAQGRLVEYLGPAGVTLFYVSDIAKAIGYDLGYVGPHLVPGDGGAVLPALAGGPAVPAAAVPGPGCPPGHRGLRSRSRSSSSAGRTTSWPTSGRTSVPTRSSGAA